MFMVRKRRLKQSNPAKPKPLIPKTKLKPVSPRTVSLEEFRKVKNNFHSIFYPLEMQRKKNPFIVTLTRGVRRPLVKANFSFERLLLAMPEQVSAVQRDYLKFDKEALRLQARINSRKLSPEKRAQASAELKGKFLAFEKKIEKPLYELYCFLKKKGISNKALGLSWWNVQPNPRK